MQKFILLAALFFSFNSLASVPYICNVSGVVELQKKPFLSGKWKTKSSNREYLCLRKSPVINFSTDSQVVNECEERTDMLNYKLIMTATLVGNENFNMRVELGRRFTYGNFQGQTIINRDIVSGEQFEEEITLEFPMTESKKEKYMLRTVRLICNPM